MDDPPSRPELMHTCPTCNRPVRPGYKFCEKCGTRIPSLYTCSKCGTQFIQPKKYCDLCGARFADDEQGPDGNGIPGTDMAERPEPSAGEDQGPGEEELQEPDQAGVPQPDEVQEPDEEQGPDEGEPPGPGEEGVAEPEEEAPGPAPGETTEEELAAIFKPKMKKERPARREIREPDTAELLEKYGSDEEEETRAPPVTGWRSWFRRKEPPPKNADEALFLSEERPAGAARVRSRKNRALQILGAAMVATAVIAAFILFGLPMLADSTAPHAESTPTPEPTMAPGPTPTVKTTPASRFTTLPTQNIPTDQEFYFLVQKNPVTGRISVIFIGSSSVDGITVADIRVTRADGSVASGVILPLKGVNELTLSGSKETDRVEIIARKASGETYRVYDELVSGSL